MPGLKVGEKAISNLGYAVDALLIAENENDLPNLLIVRVPIDYTSQDFKVYQGSGEAVS